MRIAAVIVGVLLGAGAPAGAQDDGRAISRVAAIDTVIGIQDVFADAFKPGLIFDTYTAVEVRSNLQVSFRPKFWRKDDHWFTLVDQLSLPDRSTNTDATITCEPAAGVSWASEKWCCRCRLLLLLRIAAAEPLACV